MLDSLIAAVLLHGPAVLQAIGAVVTCATVIVKLTPSQEDDALLAKVIKFLDYFSVVNPK